jgi:hypothetical protein
MYPVDSSETDEALESIDRAFAGVFWGRARSKDGSQEVDGDSQIHILNNLLFISFKCTSSSVRKRKEKEDLRCA